jgi:Tol biopolymer transport system component
MADKERKQDLTGPDEEALEQHVREMLDVNIPEGVDKSEKKPEALEEKAPKSTKIGVVDSAEEIPSAPAVTPKKSPKKAVAIAVSHDEEAPEVAVDATVPDELEAAIDETNKELAEQAGIATAPLIETPPSNSKKVVITHFEDPEPETDNEAISESEAEPSTEESEAPKTEDDSEESPLEPEIESDATERAVNDIIASEGDELLAMKDQKSDLITEAKPTKSKKKGKNPFKNSGFRWILAFLIMAGILAVIIIPTTRYAILNAAGIRSSASVVILDQTTQQPLKNVTVTLAGQKAQTDSNGKAKLEQLKLGPTELAVEKRAFASVHRAETIGWGSNPLADVSLKPTGNQYAFTVTDALSGKPLSSAEATYSESSANADEKGVVTLTLDNISESQVKVQIKAVGYRDETVDLTLSNKQNIDVKMVPSHKIAFISKRSGTYDIYKIDADGKNEQLVLKGTGNEQSNLTLAPHPGNDVAMLVTSRDGKRDTDGSLLTDVTFVNLKDGSIKQIAQSSSVRVVDWIGTRFVYVQTTVGAKADDPQRNKLMSYDYVSGNNRQLATSNYFNDIVSAGGKIYYAPSGAYQQGVNLGMFSVFADGSGKQSIFGKETWNIIRNDYNHFVLAVQQDWYDYTIGGSQPTKLNGQPSNTTARTYFDSPDGKTSVWIDVRDGKPALIVYDTAARSEKVLFAQTGIKGPIRWVNNNAFVYRVSSGETADYVISILASEPKKLTDVTDSKGIERYTY